LQTVKIVSNSGLTEAEIQKMVADAQSNVEGDKKKKELADLKNAADGLSYTTERSLEEYASMLKEKDRDEIKVDLENLKKQLGTGDPEKVRAAIKQLEGSAYRIADTIYAAETEKK
jgi:molecular chaperone DnaK